MCVVCVHVHVCVRVCACAIACKQQVQASIGANTYVITGNSENKNLQDLLPGITKKYKITTLTSITANSEKNNLHDLPPCSRKSLNKKHIRHHQQLREQEKYQKKYC
jgi:hypothetical protein